MIFRTLAALGITAALLVPRAQAEFPTRLVRLVVTTAPGTSGDIVARLIAPALSKHFQQTVVVENRPGANGNLAATEVSRSEPDGHTILVIPSGTLVANLYLYPKSSAAALEQLTPLTRLVTNDFVLVVRPQLGLKTLKDLSAHVRNNPGKFTVASSSRGSYPNLAAEMLKQNAKLDVLIVTHNGESAAVTAAAGGHVDAVIAASAALDSFTKSGTLVAIASTGTERNPLSPEVPTLSESGAPDSSILGFIAVAVPSAVPPDIQGSLRSAFMLAIRQPQVHGRLRDIHFIPVSDTQEEMKAVILKERARLEQVIRQMGGALE